MLCGLFCVYLSEWVGFHRCALSFSNNRSHIIQEVRGLAPSKNSVRIERNMWITRWTSNQCIQTKDQFVKLNISQEIAHKQSHWHYKWKWFIYLQTKFEKNCIIYLCMNYAVYVVQEENDWFRWTIYGRSSVNSVIHIRFLFSMILLKNSFWSSSL